MPTAFDDLLEDEPVANQSLGFEDLLDDAAEEPAYTDRGYLSQLGNALKTGTKQALQGAKTSLGAVTGNEHRTAEGLQGLAEAGQEAGQNISRDDAALAQQMAQNAAEFDQAKGFWNKAGEFVDYAGIVADNPAAALKMGIQSAPNALISIPVALGGAAAGAGAGALAGVTTGPGAVVTGLLGAGIGGITANAAMEAGPAIYERINEATGGQSANWNPEQFKEFITANSELVSEGLKSGLKRGAVIGAVDAASAGLGGRILGTGAKAGSGLIRKGAATGLEMATEGGGEMLAGLADTGKVDSEAAVQEMIGGVATGVPSAMAGKFITSRGEPQLTEEEAPGFTESTAGDIGVPPPILLQNIETINKTQQENLAVGNTATAEALEQAKVNAAEAEIEEGQKEAEVAAEDAEKRVQSDHDKLMAGYQRMKEEQEAIIGAQPTQPTTDETQPSITPTEPEGTQPQATQPVAPVAEDQGVVAEPPTATTPPQAKPAANATTTQPSKTTKTTGPQSATPVAGAPVEEAPQLTETYDDALKKKKPDEFTTPEGRRVDGQIAQTQMSGDFIRGLEVSRRGAKPDSIRLTDGKILTGITDIHNGMVESNGVLYPLRYIEAIQKGGDSRWVTVKPKPPAPKGLVEVRRNGSESTIYVLEHQWDSKSPSVDGVDPAKSYERGKPYSRAAEIDRNLLTEVSRAKSEPPAKTETKVEKVANAATTTATPAPVEASKAPIPAKTPKAATTPVTAPESQETTTQEFDNEGVKNYVELYLRVPPKETKGHAQQLRETLRYLENQASGSISPRDRANAREALRLINEPKPEPQPTQSDAKAQEAKAPEAPAVGTQPQGQVVEPTTTQASSEAPPREEAREDVNPEVAKLKAEQKGVAARVKKDVAAGILDKQEGGKKIKGSAMRIDAKVRQATGKLTPKERAAKEKKEASNFVGKPVIVDGKPAKVVRTSFGNVLVKFEDGTNKSVKADKVSEITKEADRPVESIDDRLNKIPDKEPALPADATELDRKIHEATWAKERGVAKGHPLGDKKIQEIKLALDKPQSTEDRGKKFSKDTSGKKPLRQISTDDMTIYETEDGRWVDNLDPDRVDASWDNEEELREMAIETGLGFTKEEADKFWDENISEQNTRKFSKDTDSDEDSEPSETPKKAKYRRYMEAHPDSDAVMDPSGRIWSPTVRDLIKMKSSGEKVTPQDIAEAISQNLPWEADVATPSKDKIPTKEKMQGALNKEQATKVGKAAEQLSGGEDVSIRQDIPSMNNHGVGVVVVNGKFGSIYEGIARITSPIFKSNENTAVKIGTGESKAPMAVISGKWSKDQSIPDDISGWTPVGYNPDRHSFYYDKKTGEPVVGGDEAIQVGSTVWVKNPKFESASKFKFSKDTESQSTESPSPPTLVTNAAIDDMRGALGMEHLPKAEARKIWPLVRGLMGAAKSDPEYLKRRMSEVWKTKDFNSKDQFVALLRIKQLHDKIFQIEGELANDKLTKAQRKLKGDEIEAATEELHQAHLVNQHLGTEFGRLGRYRQVGMEDFTAKGMLLRIANNGGKKLSDLDPKLVKRVEQIAKNIARIKAEQKPFTEQREALELDIAIDRVIRAITPSGKKFKGLGRDKIAAMLKKRGIEEGDNVEIVEDTQWVTKSGEFVPQGTKGAKAWFGYKADGGKIVLNAASIESAARFTATLNEEIAHKLSERDSIVRHRKMLMGALTEQQKAEIAKRVAAYKDSEKPEEEVAKMVALLTSNDYSGKPKRFFDKLKTAVERSMRIIGFKLSNKKEAEYLAAEIVARGTKMLQKTKSSIPTKKKFAKDVESGKESERDRAYTEALQGDNGNDSLEGGGTKLDWKEHNQSAGKLLLSEVQSATGPLKFTLATHPDANGNFGMSLAMGGNIGKITRNQTYPSIAEAQRHAEVIASRMKRGATAEDFKWFHAGSPIESQSPQSLATSDAAWLARNPKSAEKLQRMVDEAARGAGYGKRKFHHGTPDGRFSKFEKGRGIHERGIEAYAFSDSEKVANEFRGGLWATRDATTGRDDWKIGKEDDGGDVVKAYPKHSEVKTVHLDLSNADVWEMNGGSYDEAFVTEKLKNAKKDGKTAVLFMDMRDGSYSTTGRWPMSNVAFVFDPSQIKSADPITRDDKGNVIPLEERFDQGKSDIRFNLDVESEPKGPAIDVDAEKSRLEERLKKDKEGGLDPDVLNIALAARIAMESGVSKDDFVKSIHSLISRIFSDVTQEDIHGYLKDLSDEIAPTKESLKNKQDLTEAQLTEAKAQKKSEADIKRLEAQIEKYKKRLADKNFTNPPKEFKKLDDEQYAKQLELNEQKAEFYRAANEERRKNLPLLKKSLGWTADSLNLARSIMTGLDISAVLRQGIFPTLARPTRTLRILPKMFKAMRSEEAQHKIMREIRMRPNAQWYDIGGLFLKDPAEVTPSAMEEAFSSRFLAKMPGLGPIRASERAYVTFLNLLRADTFDSLMPIATAKGPMTAEKAEALSDAVNVLTGRGKIGFNDKTAAGLNTLFFAPRYVASVFNMMAGQPMWHGTAETRKAVAAEYARFLTGAAIVYALGSALMGDDEKIETDPRSSDYGKFRVGDIRINPLGGVLQNTTLLSRVVTGQTKTLDDGEIRDLRGPDRPWGSDDVWDVLTRYGRFKLSPIVSAAVNTATGEDAVGEETTALKEAGKLFYPLSLRDIGEAMREQGVPAGTVMTMLSLLGIGVNAYSRDK